jgi:hypothetical protein
MDIVSTAIAIIELQLASCIVSGLRLIASFRRTAEPREGNKVLVGGYAGSDIHW